MCACSACTCVHPCVPTYSVSAWLRVMTASQFPLHLYFIHFSQRFFQEWLMITARAKKQRSLLFELSPNEDILLCPWQEFRVRCQDHWTFSVWFHPDGARYLSMCWADTPQRAQPAWPAAAAAAVELPGNAQDTQPFYTAVWPSREPAGPENKFKISQIKNKGPQIEYSLVFNLVLEVLNAMQTFILYIFNLFIRCLGGAPV